MRAKPIADITNPLILEEMKTFPNQATIGAFLDNPDRVEIWEVNKAIILIEKNCDDPFIFIAGTIDNVVVEEIKSLCTAEFSALYCNPAFHHLFLVKGWDLHLRVQFFYPKTFSVSNILPEDWNIYSIDNIELFQKCIGFKMTAERYGSAENFLKHGNGYVLYNEIDIISEAYTDYQCQDYAEIGIVTNPNYLRQGAATQIARYWVGECIAQNKIPIWSCNADNKASINTAFKVGFRIDRYYIQLVPGVGNVQGPKLENWIKEHKL